MNYRVCVCVRVSVLMDLPMELCIFDEIMFSSNFSHVSKSHFNLLKELLISAERVCYVIVRKNLLTKFSLMCWKVKLGKFKNPKFRWKPFDIWLLLLNFSINCTIKRELFICFFLAKCAVHLKNTNSLFRNDVRFFLLQMTFFASTKRSRKSGKKRENHNQMNVSKRFSVNSLVALQFNVVVFFFISTNRCCVLLCLQNWISLDVLLAVGVFFSSCFS